jgi:hypothetical protein
MGTQMPQQPETLLGKVLCDADLYHLTLPTYLSHAERLRCEWRQTGQAHFGRLDWAKENLHFLQIHQFQTSYGRQVLQTRKERNLAQLEIVLTHLTKSDGEKTFF